MTKKQRVDPGDWLARVIDYVRANGDNVDEGQMYSDLKCKASNHTESLIFEHPSLVHTNGRIIFECFVRNITSKDALLAFIQSQHPMCYRRVDFRGLYAFIDADIDELLFYNRIFVIDAVTESISVARAPYALSAELVAAWHNSDDSVVRK